MEHERQLMEAIESVEIARKAVLNAQGNNDSQQLQEAQQCLIRAQKLVNAIQRNGVTGDEHGQKEIHRAQEMLNHLFETQTSLQG
ncbi:hypothetical protein EDD68_11268 [Melghiribacillus thermohalophilus]|uniref:Uncharacterized protein n=1 Tax=Melghiribacillus thermohalophilus TaxID=1324956 RepID=A0A4R3MWI0_9BACI|nr:hypothetical protein [Melghiribacillus thermohalophilus]TCT20940.1 hypothetical protein EDD68_11268 [Melghiribacillus thermohalophilus]